MRDSRVHVGQDLRPRLFGTSIRPDVIAIRSEPDVDDPLLRGTSRGRPDRVDIVGIRVARAPRGHIVPPDQASSSRLVSVRSRALKVGEQVGKCIDRGRAPPGSRLLRDHSGSSDRVGGVVHVPLDPIVSTTRRRLLFPSVCMCMSMSIPRVGVVIAFKEDDQPTILIVILLPYDDDRVQLCPMPLIIFPGHDVPNPSVDIDRPSEPGPTTRLDPFVTVDIVHVDARPPAYPTLSRRTGTRVVPQSSIPDPILLKPLIGMSLGDDFPGIESMRSIVRKEGFRGDDLAGRREVIYLGLRMDHILGRTQVEMNPVILVVVLVVVAIDRPVQSIDVGQGQRQSQTVRGQQ